MKLTAQRKDAKDAKDAEHSCLRVLRTSAYSVF